MKKRTIITAMLLAAVFMLGSCGGTDPTAAPTDAPTEAPTEAPTAAPAADLARGGKAEAFRSEEGHGPELAVDGDDTTCWVGMSGSWSVSFDSPITFNTVRVRFDGKAPRWSVKYMDSVSGIYIDVPGTVKTYQTAESFDMTFCVNPLTTTGLMLNIYDGDATVSLYSLEAYYNEGQYPTDAYNSYITPRRERVYALANPGKDIFGIFPETKYAATNTANWTASIERDRSKLYFDNGKWCRGLDETTVFDAEIRHVQNDDPSLNWTMRFGLGGQIYSFEAGGLGELVPLQNAGAEWMDEVWQIVAVSHSSMYDRAFTPATHFIHQAGMYKGIDHGSDNYATHYMDDTFYSPRLAEYWDEEEASYSVLNYGVTPSINISRSDTIYYTRMTDKGDGVIEFLYGIANYSDNVIDFMNLPWGGVSHKRLPDIIVSEKGSYSYSLWEGNENNYLSGDYSATHGWMGYTQDINDPNGFTVAFVLGGEDRFEDGSIPDNQMGTGTFGAFFAAQGKDNRDYNVFTPVETERVKTDDLFWCRIYVVIGKLSDVAKKAGDISASVRYGILRPETSDTLGIGMASDDGKALLLPTEDGALFDIYKTHVYGSRPLFLLYDVKNDRYSVSTDAYAFSTKLPLADYVDTTKQPWKRLANREKTMYINCIDDGNTEYMGILGYVMLADGENIPEGWKLLSELVGTDVFSKAGKDDASVIVKIR